MAVAERGCFKVFKRPSFQQWYALSECIHVSFLQTYSLWHALILQPFSPRSEISHLVKQRCDRFFLQIVLNELHASCHDSFVILYCFPIITIRHGHDVAKISVVMSVAVVVVDVNFGRRTNGLVVIWNCKYSISRICCCCQIYFPALTLKVNLSLSLIVILRARTRLNGSLRRHRSRSCSI